LDQVQEAHATIAVFLGNRHHQTQVAAGKFALHALELPKLLAEQLAASTQAGWRFERLEHQLTQLAANGSNAGRGSVLGLELPQVLLQAVHLL